MLKKYEIGQVLEKYKDGQDRAFFDIDSSGAVFIVCMAHPKQQEIDSFHAGNFAKFKFLTMGAALIFLAKIGNLPWMDAFYSPHLSQDLPATPVFSDGMGLALTIMLIDSATGEIKHMRLIGLSTDFSAALMDGVQTLQKLPFSRPHYDQSVGDIMRRHTTKDLVTIASNYYKTK